MHKNRSLIIVVVFGTLTFLFGCAPINSTQVVPTATPEMSSTTTATPTTPPTPTPEPTATKVLELGIETPVLLLEVDLRFISVEQVEEIPYTLADGVTEEKITAVDGNYLIILTAESLNGKMGNLISLNKGETAIFSVLDNGEIGEIGIYLGAFPNHQTPNIVELIFSIPEGNTIKSIRLPDGVEIDLSSLLE